MPVPGPSPLALRLLRAVLPSDERESILGDLTEMVADRHDAGRAWTRAWLWGQVLLFAAAAAVARLTSLWRFPMSGLAEGVRRAAQRLTREGRYSVTMVLILACGIGPAAAVIATVDRVLWRPLDYQAPERLGMIRIDLAQLSGHPGLSPAEAIDLRESGLFESVETQTRLNEVTMTVGDQLISLSQISFTTGMLPMLGRTTALGRSFVESDLPPVPTGPPARSADTAPSPPPTQPVMIDYGTWQTHFGGTPDVLGRVVQLNGGPSEIIGVLPEGFRLVTGRAVPQRIDVYTPLRLRDFRNSWQFPTLVRLKPGTTFAQVQQGLDALALQIKQEFPQFYDGRLRYTVTPLLSDLTNGIAPALRAATAGVLLLALIAFTNATALVLARLKARERDFAVRSALGAGRRALVIDVLAESLVLGAVAALVGGALAAATTLGIREVIPRTVPRWQDIAVGWDLLGYSTVLPLGGLALFGLIPVWKVSRSSTWQMLRAGTVQGGKTDGARSRLMLVGAQIALTVVLAFGCVQLVRSAASLRQVHLGFDPHVMTFRVPFDFRRHPTPADRARLYQRIRDRVAEVPGVVSAGVVTHLPLSGATMMDGYQQDLSKEPSFEQSANYQAVTPGYFDSVRIPLLQGRDFTDQEDATSAPVVIVDESLATTAFPGRRDVIGLQLRLGWGLPNSRIVGVVGHARTIDVGRQVRPQVYAPIGNLFQNYGIVTVRTAGSDPGLAAAVERAINEVGPGRAVSNVAPLTNNVEAATSTLVAVTTLVTALAVSAGVLSAVGLYLVIAYLVHQRRRETAIRTALGASRVQLTWQHLRTSAWVMAVALPVGGLLAAAAAPLFSQLVFQVEARDQRSLAMAVAVAAVIGLVGALLPVRQASDPNVVKVLRGD